MGSNLNFSVLETLRLGSAFWLNRFEAHVQNLSLVHNYNLYLKREVTKGQLTIVMMKMHLALVFETKEFMIKILLLFVDVFHISKI